MSFARKRLAQGGSYAMRFHPFRPSVFIARLSRRVSPIEKLHLLFEIRIMSRRTQAYFQCTVHLMYIKSLLTQGTYNIRKSHQMRSISWLCVGVTQISVLFVRTSASRFGISHVHAIIITYHELPSWFFTGWKHNRRLQRSTNLCLQWMQMCVYVCGFDIIYELASLRPCLHFKSLIRSPLK